MSRAIVVAMYVLASAAAQATIVEYSWFVLQENGVWFSAPYPPDQGDTITFSDIPVASGPGLLSIHARGDYTIGGDEGLPELIAFDLDELYVPTEIDAQQQVVVDGLFACNYPGVFPSLERGPQSPGAPVFASPPPFCLPVAGPDAGATIIAIHDGIGQDVEWEQEFFLDAAGMQALTADGVLQINASTLDANVQPSQQAVPPYFEMRLSYIVPEPASGGLLVLGLGALVLAKRRAGERGARQT